MDEGEGEGREARQGVSSALLMHAKGRGCRMTGTCAASQRAYAVPASTQIGAPILPVCCAIVMPSMSRTGKFVSVTARFAAICNGENGMRELQIRRLLTVSKTAGGSLGGIVTPRGHRGVERAQVVRHAAPVGGKCGATFHCGRCSGGFPGRACAV